ncbi:MAG: M28 family peptidase [Acidobacteria bacterium]|nr:M28 family peptidase [Acidobacteriota bacterium]
MRLLFVTAVLAPLAFGESEGIAGDRIRAHVRFLSSDLLEGRGVGARGGELAAEYIATQFHLAGLKPAGADGSYFQRVPLVGVKTAPTAVLTVGAARLRWQDEFVGTTFQQKPATAFEADAVFVGHGITAPEYQWDDYAGTDVKGKVVVLFTNEPPSEDAKFFGGRALTYYGRWSYKFENAARHGAAAVVIIHTTPTAGYGWEVVRGSWAREDPQVALKAGEEALAFAGWVTQEAGARLVAGTGKSVAAMLGEADRRGFKAYGLGVQVGARFSSAIRKIETRNVVGRVDGSDGRLKEEAVIFSAHWDHLGVGIPVNGDAIYNGAVDNATGCGILMEVARAWAALPHKPRRSALFLAVTAEESGLRGSEYYGRNPLVAPGKTALALNYDGFFPFGRTRDIVVDGAERTTAWGLVQETARRFQLEIKPDPHPEQGHFYRSDHFSFARVGIPAFSINQGDHYLGKPAAEGAKIFAEYNGKHYHQPSDQYEPGWNFAGMEEMARFGMALGTTAANLGKLPTWRAGDEFLAAREASFK